MDFFVTHGSYALLFLALYIAGFGVPIPEDVVLLAAGVLVHRQITSLPITLIVCAAGVLAGDITLFRLARRLGPAIYRRRPFAQLFTPERRAKLERLFARHGGKIVFVGRHMPGLRNAIFAFSATQGIPLKTFVLWDVAGLVISLPLVTGLGYVFSDNVDRARHDLARVDHWALLIGVGIFALVAARAAWRARR